MRTVLAGLALAGAVASAAPASAYYAVGRPEAPWCAVMNMGYGDMHWDCSFPSVEACRPYVIAGNRGFCNPNPAYHGPVVRERRWKRRVRHHRQ